MSVTQEMIANKVGLDRSTVSKILNGRASDFVSRQTIERVLAAAREMGYDFARLRHTHSRQFERTDLDLGSEFDIILESGEVYDSGTAAIRNISEGSALIANLSTRLGTLPLKPFTISLIATEGRLKGVSVLARVTRLEMRDGLALALEFIEVSPVSAKKLGSFMERFSSAPEVLPEKATARGKTE
jgi:transcriptional regulator with XRE-family HTH domain